MLSNLKQFFLNLKKPLLIGFSGGGDSLALVHALFQLDIPLHLVHFDHAWREESFKEAEHLKNWAESLAVPFFCERSIANKKDEELARTERYAFFLKLFRQGDYEALVLAHHQNDQVETVLKRVLEGAHLTNLRGMQSHSYYEEMPVWRPLLGVPKKELATYLTEHHLVPIEDKTNFDPHFLRARMRNQILPTLTKQFGKEIDPSLLRLGEYGEELHHYLEGQTEKFQSSLSQGPFGWMIDFTPFYPLKRVEVRYFVKRFFEREGFSLSHSTLNQIVEALEGNRPNYKVVFADQTLIVDRTRLFWVQDEAVEVIMDQKPAKEPVISSWRDLWQGKLCVTLPEGFEWRESKGEFRKLWNENRVPAFLRNRLPIVYFQGEPYAELLTGLAPTKNFLHEVEVTIEVKKRDLVSLEFMV